MVEVLGLVKGVDVVKSNSGPKVEFWVVDENFLDRMTRNENQDRPISQYREIAGKVLRDLGIAYESLEWQWGDEPGFVIRGTSANKLVSISVLEQK